MKALLALGVLILSLHGWSVPFTVSYQKKLQDRNTGKPMEGNRSIRLTFWDASQGGNRLGKEIPDTYQVKFSQGVFNQAVTLSQTQWQQLFSGARNFVWIQVEDVSLTPPATYPREKYSPSANTLAVTPTLEKESSGEALQTVTQGQVLKGCPSGFTLIAGNFGSKPFCISTLAEVAADWLTASNRCYQKNNRGGLCTANEWALACQSRAALGMSDSWEWVADLYAEDYAYVMVVSGCTSASTNLLGNSYPSRCCVR